MSDSTSRFPRGFLWGTATSSYQIEGGIDVGGRTPSIWDTFSHTPGKIANGDNGDRGVDHLNRFAEDVALMKELGVNAYRFSISWSRLLPSGRGAVNPKGLRFYRDLVRQLLETGITPMVSLYHWDLPQVLEDEGGWLNPDSPDWFTEYATIAKESLGDLIPMWSTLNEPWCSAFLGYSSGIHAPGKQDPGSGYLATHHLMLAHHRAMHALRATAVRPDDQLGIVLNLIPSWPATNDPQDVAAAAAVDTIQNRMFLETAIEGRYPEEILEHHERFGVADRIDPKEILAEVAELDYVGINYYNANRIRFEPDAPSSPNWPGTEGSAFLQQEGELTHMGWGVEPEGLTWILLRVAEEYPHLPLYVCENGAAYPDVVAKDGEIHDLQRISYLEDHTEAVAKAIAGGADVQGYFVWSLLDNFEWAEGYEKRFGLIHVDPATLDRKIKQSGHWYRDFVRQNS